MRPRYFPEIGVLVVVVAAGLSCGDPSSPDSGFVGPLDVTLNTSSGAVIADTIEAMLPAQLIATVTDSKGIAVPDTTVQFLANGGVYFGTSAAAALRPISVKTDAEGKARVYMRLDTIAGVFQAVAALPFTTVKDSMSVTVLPGAVASLTMAPRDSVVYVNNSYPLRIARLDRRKNRRSDLPDIAIRTAGVITMPESTTVRGAAFGRTIVKAQMAELKDSVYVSVVPTATIVAVSEPALLGGPLDRSFYVAGLDGSGRGTIPGLLSFGQVGDLRFNAAGDRLLYDDMQEGASRAVFAGNIAGGAATRLLPSVPYEHQSQVQMSRDGAWIYYTETEQSGAHAIWRATPAGTNLTRITPVGSHEYDPTPSPDGARLAAFTTTPTGNDPLTIRTLATGAVDTAAVFGEALRWSPSGNEVAYIGADQLRVYDVATKTVTILDADNRYTLRWSRIDWSPDGSWLLSCAPAFNSTPTPMQLVLVRRSPLLVIPLAWSRANSLCRAAWKP